MIDYDYNYIQRTIKTKSSLFLFFVQRAINSINTHAKQNPYIPMYGVITVLIEAKKVVNLDVCLPCTLARNWGIVGRGSNNIIPILGETHIVGVLLRVLR